MFPKLLDIGELVYQFIDFAVKAFVAYSQTEQGSKEWADVETALVKVGALAFEVPPTSAPSESAPGSGQPLQEWSAEQLRSELANQADERAQVERDVIRAPKKHGAE